jgi:hypothetical protein
MFSARAKKAGKKELPQWKRDLEQAEDEPPAKRATTSSDTFGEELRAPVPSGSAAASSSSAAGRTENDDGGGGDDDDDDNFDPSNYDLGSGDADGESEDQRPSSGDAEAVGGALPPQVPEYSAAKGVQYRDFDGRDTICFHGRGATNEACQELVGKLPGYRATRFVKELVFVLLSDHSYAVQAMEALNKAPLLDGQGNRVAVRTEWAKRSLRPY